ncbi:MAG: hypothetical protein WBN06_00080 [Lysobacterales bacterium]
MVSFIRVFSIICLVLALASLTSSEALSSELYTQADKQASSAKKVGSQKSVEEIAREMVNPLAPFWRFDYIYERRNYQGSIPGADDQRGTVHNFQFTMPFREKDGRGWVFRFALPYHPDQPVYWADRGYPEWLIRQEDPTPQEDAFWDETHSHTNDVTFDLTYGGVNESGRILNYGVAGILPTSSDTSNNRQQFIMGPAVNIGKITDWGVYGVLASHIIDLIEKRDKGAPDTTQTTLQVYFSYDLGRGWQLISNPVITYDWEGDKGNKFNLPLGGGIAKTIKIGKIPLRFTAEAQYFVASTDRFGPDWLYKFSVSPIMPSKHTRH